MYTGTVDWIPYRFAFGDRRESSLYRVGPLLFSWCCRPDHARCNPAAVGFVLDRTLTQTLSTGTLQRQAMSNANDNDKADGEERRRTAAKTDPELLRRLQEGDNRAWEQLLDEWQGPLYQYLFNHLPTPENAYDVLQDTFEALVTAIKRFDGNVAISTFIYSIASRKSADFYRKRKVTGELTDFLSSEKLDISVDGIVFRDVLEAMQPQYREALLLRYKMGLSVSEMAAVLGRSYKATESLLSRSRKQLQDDLGKAGFGL